MFLELNKAAYIKGRWRIAGVVSWFGGAHIGVAEAKHRWVCLVWVFDIVVCRGCGRRGGGGGGRIVSKESL